MGFAICVREFRCGVLQLQMPNSHKVKEVPVPAFGPIGHSSGESERVASTTLFCCGMDEESSLSLCFASEEKRANVFV
jgi:hypothetical protein